MVGNNAALFSNGVEGALRFQLPVVLRRSLLEPFGFVGLGWQHYSLTNGGANTSNVAGSDDVMSLPYGAGLDFAFGSFIADARFTYRQTFLNDLMRGPGGRLNTWGVTGQVGLMF